MPSVLTSLRSEIVRVPMFDAMLWILVAILTIGLLAWPARDPDAEEKKRLAEQRQAASFLSSWVVSGLQATPIQRSEQGARSYSVLLENSKNNSSGYFYYYHVTQDDKLYSSKVDAFSKSGKRKALRLLGVNNLNSDWQNVGPEWQTLQSRKERGVDDERWFGVEVAARSAVYIDNFVSYESEKSIRDETFDVGKKARRPVGRSFSARERELSKTLYDGLNMADAERLLNGWNRREVTLRLRREAPASSRFMLVIDNSKGTNTGQLFFPQISEKGALYTLQLRARADKPLKQALRLALVDNEDHEWVDVGTQWQVFREGPEIGNGASRWWGVELQAGSVVYIDDFLLKEGDSIVRREDWNFAPVPPRQQIGRQ